MKPITPAIDLLLGRCSTADPSECWVPAGRLQVNGYSTVQVGGREGRREYGHRVSYQHFVGSIPDGYDIDHLCRNRGCVNPDHLEAVTRQVNLLRGQGWTAFNASKSECKRGHAFTPENTRHDGRGRQCRACDVIRRSGKAAA